LQPQVFFLEVSVVFINLLLYTLAARAPGVIIQAMAIRPYSTQALQVLGAEGVGLGLGLLHLLLLF
jgi:hypothetical protein